MSFELISAMIGYTCHPLSDGGSVAIINTPLTFADGDEINAYVELGKEFVRFFDDGDVFFHFLGRGIPLDDEGGTQFLSEIAASTGVSFSVAGNVELRAASGDAAAAFVKYMAAMSAYVDWEKTWEAEFYEATLVSVAK